MTSPESIDFKIGATKDFGLRVSVATLSKLLFHHPVDQRLMLGLEHVSTLRQFEDHSNVVVKAQPFGGGIRILDSQALRDRIGEFRFDSQRSRDEGDFRVQIRPQNWKRVEELCLHQFLGEGRRVIESRPDRELVEEFRDALGVEITPNQYKVKHLGVAVEDIPRATNSVRAAGALTARIYNIYEVRILDSSLIGAILENNRRYTDQELCDLAEEDAGGGGRGRANAILSLPINDLKKLYLSMPLESRSAAIRFEGHLLDENVLAILEDVPTMRYRWVGLDRGS